jgi:hypothetical protein
VSGSCQSPQAAGVPAPAPARGGDSIAGRITERRQAPGGTHCTGSSPNTRRHAETHNQDEEGLAPHALMITDSRGITTT